MSLRASLILWASVLCFAVVAGAVVDAVYTYNATLSEAERDGRNLTESLAHQVSDTFEAVDGILLALSGRVASEGAGPAARAELRESMAALVSAMPRLHDLFVLDEQGRLVVSNGSAELRPDLRFEAQPYFAYHRSHSDSSAHIGVPQLSPMETVWIVPVTRRIARPDGGFGGIVVAYIALDYFESICGGLDVSENGAVMLVRDDAIVVVRKPNESVGRKIPSLGIFADPYRFEAAGQYIKPSAIDGVVHLTEFRRLDRYPLTVMVSLAPKDFMAQWRQHSISIAFALTIAVVTAMLLAIVLSAQIAQRRRAEDHLAALALIDGLTGLANRRQFDLVLDREWRRAARDRAPLGLLMIDVDNFKAFNDLYGHLLGDDALTSIAGTIASSIVRPSDLAARYGGEEFAVILPGSDGSSTLVVAERIRRAVLALALSHAGSTAGVATVSIGASSIKPVSFDRPTALVEAADAALYDAKRSGRNQTVLAPAFVAPDRPLLADAELPPR